MAKGHTMSLLTDVEKLKKAALPEVRETIAAKVSQYFNDGVFDEAEAKIAAEIVRLLARDAEIRVRKTLSEHLKNNPGLPRDVAMTLAKDVLEVSLPIIEFSKVLTDDDLIEIIRSTQQVAKLTAISRRESVSELVSDELLSTQNEEVVVSLFANQGAKISDENIERAVREFRNNGGIIKTLINRGDLSIGIAEKMINLVSGEFKTILAQKYNLSDKIAAQAVTDGRESATLGLLSDDDPTLNFAAVSGQSKARSVEDMKAGEKKLVQVSQLVNHLYKEGRLTHSIVLRALCEGNLMFFEVGISRLAGVPTMNARMLLRDPNPEAFQSLCAKANMPSSTSQAMRVMLDFVVKEDNAGTAGKAGFSQRMIEHIIGHGYDKTIPLMPYLMALIGSELRTEDIIN